MVCRLYGVFFSHHIGMVLLEERLKDSYMSAKEDIGMAVLTSVGGQEEASFAKPHDPERGH